MKGVNVEAMDGAKKKKIVKKYEASTSSSTSDPAFANLINASAVKESSENHEKSKLEMGGRFKSESEDRGNARMVKEIKVWFVISAFNILAYVFSQERSRMESTLKFCRRYEGIGDESWLLKHLSPVENPDFIIMWCCRHLFWAQMLAALYMIFAVWFLITDHFASREQPMMVLYYGIACGLPGKLTVELLGGNGKLWLRVWAMFCVLQFLVAAVVLMSGPIGRTKSSTMVVPYWAQRAFFLGMFLFTLPLMYVGL